MDFANCPALLINKLAHMIALDMDRRLKSCDVSMSQWVMLKQLWGQEGKSQVELQELLGLDAATVTGLVQRMTHLDLVQRRTDSSDKRVQRVYLTERGRALKQITAAFEQEVNAHVLQGFSADERVFFARLLIRAQQNYEGK